MNKKLTCYAVSNDEVVKSIKTTKNVITKNSYENILLNRASRGDSDALKLLYNHLKGW